MRNTTHRLMSLIILATAAACAQGGDAIADTPKPPSAALTYKGPKETAILAGGCFWGMENVLRKAPGVISVEVGYAGGTRPNVKYEDVEQGDTNYAESVRVVFDPSIISYKDLLLHWYFRGHNPTTVNRQNNDVGTQYRSEIFTTTPEQAGIARDAIARVDASGNWGDKVVTKVEPATTFVVAEDYHQDYLIKNPHGYNDHYLRNFDF